MIMRSNRIYALLITLGVAVAMCGAAPTHAEDTAKMLALNPQSLKFTPIPDLPSCATGATVRGDPRWGPAWVYLKLATGCRVPTHWHSANEDLVVISGQGTLTMKDGPSLPFVPGAYASLPSRHMHQASCTRTCLLFSIADGAFDIHYVDANGEEISAEEALKAAARTQKAKPRPKKTKK